MLFHLLNLINFEHEPYAYVSVMFRATCAVLFGFFSVLVLMPRTIRFLARRKLGDQPEFDRLSSTTATMPILQASGPPSTSSAAWTHRGVEWRSSVICANWEIKRVRCTES